MADPATLAAVGRLVVSPVLQRLGDWLGKAVFCKTQAAQLQEALVKLDQSRTAEDLSVLANRSGSQYRQFDGDMLELCALLERAEVVIEATIALRPLQLFERAKCSGQLKELSDKLQKFADFGARAQLRQMAEQVRQQPHEDLSKFHQELSTAAARATTLVPRLGAAPTPDTCPPDAQSHIFQHLDTLVPQMVSMLSLPPAPASKRVLAVVGMPGLGKTVLSHRAFDQVKQQFDRALFLPVSQTPDVLGLLRKAWDAFLPRMAYPGNAPAQMLAELLKQLSGKRVLLVLDDVWQQTHLAQLNFATYSGQCHADSRLLVTTRDEHVLQQLDQAELCTIKPPLLKSPYDGHLLCYHAFGGQLEPPPAFSSAVEDALRECKGLPLTLQVVGAALRGKTVDEWGEFLHKLANVDPGMKLDATASLIERCRPSYEELGVFARQCFMRFAAYPEDHRLQVVQLKRLWAALAPATEQGHALEWAAATLAELLARNLLLATCAYNPYHGRDEPVVFMHDVLRDLAVLESQKAGNGCWYKPSAGIRTLPQEWLDTAHTDHALLPACTSDILPGCLPVWMPGVRLQYEGAHEVSLQGNPLAAWPPALRLPSLRLLDLSGCGDAGELAIELPPTVRALRVDSPQGCALPPSLRYLGCGHGTGSSVPPLTKMLPDSKPLCGIEHLSNLQTLDLSGSWQLVELPESLAKLSSLRVLDLQSCGSLQVLPDSLGQLGGLQTLHLSDCSDLASLPDSLGQLGALQTLELRYCSNMVSLPDSLGQLGALQTLELSYCRNLASLPNSLGQLGALQTLDLRGCNNLASLPDSLGQLGALQTLDLSNCNDLASLPDSLGQLDALQTLYLSGCGKLAPLPDCLGQLGALPTLYLISCRNLASLPDRLGQLGALHALYLSDCIILASLPNSLGQLGVLQTLHLSGCMNMKSLPDSLGQLGALQTLDLSYCSKLASLPDSLGQLGALQTLNLSECSNLASLPDSLGQLGALQILYLSYCDSLASLPDSLGQLGALQTLTLCGCRNLASLPDSLGQLGALQTLDLGRCSKLASLPDSLGQLGALQTLDLRDCRYLVSLPDSLGQLGALQSLNITGCTALEVLPEALGRLSSLRTLNLTGCRKALVLPTSLQQQATLVVIRCY